jgi:hypothetical protein
VVEEKQVGFLKVIYFFIFFYFLENLILFSFSVSPGFDPLLNIVLDSTVEYMRDPDDPYKMANETRALGLVVCRGTSVVLISPHDGMEEIANPFAAPTN